jgi:hypothetical protein
MTDASSNKRVNLTNHGPDSKLQSKACVAVVCRLRAVRWAEQQQPR